MKNIVSDKVFSCLVNLLPTTKSKKFGRPKCCKEDLLRGILLVLKYDIPWNKLPLETVSSTSCWRYFNELQRRGILKNIHQTLVDQNLDIDISSIDSTVSTSFNFKNGVGFNGKHKKYGTKISVLSDKNGLPYDLVFDKGSKHDLHFVDIHLKNTVGKTKKIINMDKGYTSKDMRRNLRKKGISVNMETRKNDYSHKKGPKFKLNQPIYKYRFLIEQKFSWLKSFRRVRTRKDHSFALFKGFVYLSAIIVLIRSFDF